MQFFNQSVSWFTNFGGDLLWSHGRWLKRLALSADGCIDFGSQIKAAPYSSRGRCNRGELTVTEIVRGGTTAAATGLVGISHLSAGFRLLGSVCRLGVG